MHTSDEYDAVVIGAGHNRLVAGCYLNRSGAKALVVEAGKSIGGMTGTAPYIPEAPNHRINSCALDIIFIHAAGIIEDLGLAHFGYREIECDPVNAWLGPDGESILIWRDVRRTAEDIRRYSRADANAYLDLVRKLDAGLSIGLPMMMVNPTRPTLRSIGGVAKAAARHRKDVLKVPRIFLSSVAEVIDEHFRHPVVRDAIAAQCGVVGPITNDGSALLMLFFPFYHRFGAHRVVGGTQGLPEALAAAYRAGGGHLRTEAVVDEILIRDGRAGGVRLSNGEKLFARRGVIATCDARTALGGLLPQDTLEPGVAARVNHIPAWGDGWADLKVDVALRGQLRLDTHHRARNDGVDLRKPAVFIGGFDQSVAAYPEARAGQVPSDIGMWSVIPTAADPTQAPEGQDTLYLWVNPMAIEPTAGWDAATDAVIKKATQYYDGIEELEIARWTENPYDRARRLRATNGCLYHTDMTLLRMGPLRPALGLSGYRTPVPGYFLGSAGSHPAAAVTGIPGRLAVKELLRASKSR